MGDLITRKPTAIMLELLRKGAASPKGIMTLSDHNDRTQDGILRRDMAEVVAEPGATHSWLVINDRGRAYLAELDRAQQQAEEAPTRVVLTRSQLYPEVARPGPAWQWCYAYAVDGAPAITYGTGLASLRDMLRRKFGRSVVIEESWKRQEPVSAPVAAEEQQEPPERPAAPQGPALADLAKITEGTVTLGSGPTAVVRPSLVVVAYGSVHEFADMGAWVEVCGRCGGEGVTPFKWVHAGVCFGCNRTGLRPEVFSGTREERDAFVYAWALRKDRERVADEKRAARAHAKRVAAWERWEGAHADLVAWCRSLTPDSTERILHDRCAIEDTREEAARCYAGEEIIDTPRRLSDGGPEAGRWWARLGYWETAEYFDSYGHRVAGLIREVRRGFEPLDGKGTAFLTAVMRRAVEAQSTSRYAGPVDAVVSVTGTVRVVMSVDGWGGRSQRLIILEGTGEHAGITLKTYTNAGAAWELEKGQEGVTVTGTVSKHQERSGARETTVKRPKISA
jgi:hypothetical protein